MVHVRYYMYVVERGKLIAFCKVFQHHSPSFSNIPYHLSLSYIIPYNPTSFPIILHHSTPFNILPYYPTTFSPILPYSPSFSIILQHSTNRHYFSTIFFDNIFFRQHSPTFYKIIFRQEIFVICCQIKNLSFAVLSICYYHYLIINLILSISYYQYLNINLLLSTCYYHYLIIIMILSLSYYQFDIISLIITKLFSIDIHL